MTSRTPTVPVMSNTRSSTPLRLPYPAIAIERIAAIMGGARRHASATRRFRPIFEIREPDRDRLGVVNRVASVNTWTPWGFSDTWTITISEHFSTPRCRRLGPLMQPWPVSGVERRSGSCGDDSRPRR